MEVFHDDWQTVEEVGDGLTRSTIVFESWPEIPGNHLACGVLEDGAWVDESPGITIIKLGKLNYCGVLRIISNRE